MYNLINKLLVPPESDDLSLAGFEGVLAVLVRVVVVLEVVVRRLDTLVLQFVDGVDVQGNVILQTAGLGLAGQLSSGLSLKTQNRKLKFIPCLVNEINMKTNISNDKIVGQRK